jgi:chromosome segregation ATPase
MFLENVFTVVVFLFFLYVRPNAALLSTGQHVNLVEMMQLLQNQTTELRNLKQQTESDRLMLQNQTAELNNLKQQAETDRSTIQLLQRQTMELGNIKQQTEMDRSKLQNQTAELRNLNQQTENRVSVLEAELKNLTTSSNNEFSAFLDNMTHVVQTLTIREEHDKNLTKQLNDAAKNIENLKVEARYRSLSLLDIHIRT